MYGKSGVTGVAGAGALALTGRPVWGLVLIAVLSIVLGLMLIRAVCLREQA
jgi:hypothetical protein